MLRLSRLLIASFVALIGTTVIAAPAFANYQVKTTNEVHFAYTETFACPFDIRVHLDGFFKSVDYYDNSGFRYKTINTPGGGGPFTVTYSAHGTTLTQRSEAFSEVVTYNRDGSAKTYTERGPVAKYTVPGEGIVLLNVGTATWSEPDENVLFMAGPHQAATGDFDAFCAAFG